MSYTHTLRGEAHARSQKFEPLFLAVIKKRGKFFLSEESLDEYKKECIASGQSFTNWLSKNNLSLDRDGKQIKIFDINFHFSKENIFAK